MRARAYARVSSIRFSAYYCLGFTAAYGDLTCRPYAAMLGLVYCVTYCSAVELLNRYTDRIEDKVNQPVRTLICSQLGYENIRKAAIACWLLVVSLGVLMVSIRRTWLSAAAVVLTVLIGVSYSVGPAFNRHRYLSLVALTTSLSMPIITGAVMSDSGARPSWPIVLVEVTLLTFISLSIAGIKDITDIEGDKIKGYESLWLSTLGSPRRNVCLAIIIAVQVVTIILSVQSQTIPFVAYLDLVIPAAEVMLISIVRRSMSEQRHLLRESMHNLTFFATALCLLTLVPTLNTLSAVMASTVWWVVASRYLHWHNDFSAKNLRAVLQNAISVPEQMPNKLGGDRDQRS